MSTLRPVPLTLLGGHEIVGGCVALPLDRVRARMVGRRDHLARHHHLPPDPAALPATRSEARKQERLRYHLSLHEEYLRLATALAEIEEATERGADLELAAGLLSSRSSAIERWSGIPILSRQFLWAECRGCGRRYMPEECAPSDWSRVSDPLAGIGGGCLACPAGHVIFAMQTWVA